MQEDGVIQIGPKPDQYLGFAHSLWGVEDALRVVVTNAAATKDDTVTDAPRVTP